MLGDLVRRTRTPQTISGLIDESDPLYESFSKQNTPLVPASFSPSLCLKMIVFWVWAA